MAREPEDRYPSARALADDVERWIADEPVSARPEPVSARLGRWARRHRTTVAALGLSLATAVVLLTVLNVQVGRASGKRPGRCSRQGGAGAYRGGPGPRRRQFSPRPPGGRGLLHDHLRGSPARRTRNAAPARKAASLSHAVPRDVSQERAGDPSVAVELAESHRRYAKINRYTGQREDALPHLWIAHERFEELARQHPDRPEYRRQVANTLSDIGVALTDRKPEREEAIRVDRAAIAIYEQLLREQHDDEATLDGLATTLARLGLDLAQQRGGSEEAGRHMQRARDIMQRLVIKQPESLRRRLKLAELHNTMYTNFVGNQRRQEEALQSSQDAMSLYKELLVRAPHSPRFKAQLGMIHDNRAILFLRKGTLADAIREGQQARGFLSDVVRANPDNDRYRGHLAGVCARLGLCLTSSGPAKKPLVRFARPATDSITF